MRIEQFIYMADSAIMFATFIYIFSHSFWFSPKKRFFHYLLSQIAMISSLSNYTMFLDIGRIQTDHHKIVELPRYIDWVLSTPLQLIILGTIGQISNINIYTLCFLDILMILSGLMGEFTMDWVRWSFFGFGCICFFPLYFFLFEDFDYDVVLHFVGKFTAQKYYTIGRYLLSVWLFYPVVWIIVNLNLVNAVTTTCFYATLDFFSKVGLTLWIFLCLRHSHYLTHENFSEDIESNDIQ
jgi:sensory rhodopsin